MKLVSIHKHLVVLILSLSAWNSSLAQQWSLQQCIDTAQVRNKNLQINRNNIAIGEERFWEAKANLLPKIMANADYKYFSNLPYQLLPLSTFNPTAPEGQFKEAKFGVPHNINANLQLMVPLFNSQLYGAIQSTKLASELVGLQYKKTEEQIYFEISNLYYNAQILQNQFAFIDSNLINSERLFKNIRLLNQQLMVMGSEVSKVEFQVIQLNTQKDNISTKYQQVLNALKFAMGISTDQNLQIHTKIDFQSSREYSLLTTLDLRLIKKQNQLLSTELIYLNKSRSSPSLNLIGSYGTTGFGYNKKPNDFLKFFPISFTGLQLSFPLFNGTITQRKINQKKIEIRNNELQFDLSNEQNNMQIENAKLQRIQTKKTIETARKQIELAQTIYKQNVLQQKNGTANLNDVLLADNAIREAQQTYLSGVIDYLKADLELKKLTGNLSTNND